MAKPNLAFVNFFREKRGRRVVKVPDIVVPKDHPKDWPRHHLDFEKTLTYKVKWPHIPNEGSFSTMSEYDAKILCFGVSMEDLLHEAKTLGMKIPTCDVEKFTDDDSQKAKSPNAAAKRSLKGRKIVQPKSAPVASAPPSHAKRKKKLSEEDSTRRARNSEFINTIDVPFPDSNAEDSPDEIAEIKGMKQGNQSNLKADKSQDKLLSERSFIRPKPSESGASPDKKGSEIKALKRVNDSSPSKPVKPQDKMVSVSKTMERSRSLVSSASSQDNSTSLKALKRVKQSPCKVGKPQEKVSSRSLSFSTPSPNKSSSPSVKPQDKMVSVSKTMDRSRSLVSSASSQDNSTSLKALKRVKQSPCKVGKPQEKVSSRSLSFSTPSPNKSSSPSVKPQDKMVSVSKTMERSRSLVSSASSLDNSTSLKALKRVKQSPCKGGKPQEKVSSRSLSFSTPSPNKSSAKDKSRRNLSFSHPPKKRPCPLDITSSDDDTTSYVSSKDAAETQTNLYITKIQKLERELKQLKRENASRKESEACNKGPVFSTKENVCNKKSIKESGTGSAKRAPAESDDCADQVSIAEMILDAHNKVAPLRKDGTGRVHIGNGVYLPRKLFEDKLMSPKVSPSIAVRDTMSQIYSNEEMAERSLTGGTPVKGGPDRKKLKKHRLTPAKRECLFGLYRAKAQLQSGSSDKHFLDLAVEKKGKSTVRDKLKESYKKIQEAKLKQDQAKQQAEDQAKQQAEEASGESEADEQLLDPVTDSTEAASQQGEACYSGDESGCSVHSAGSQLNTDLETGCLDEDDY